MNNFLSKNVENFQKYFAVISIFTTFICILTGAFSAALYYKNFDIDFYALAGPADYLSLGIRIILENSLYIFASIILVINLRLMMHIFKIFAKEIQLTRLLFILSGSQRKTYKKLKFKALKSRSKVKFSILLMIILAGVFFLLLNFYGNIHNNSHSIVTGLTKVNSLTYDKDNKKINCLVYIGEINDFLYYWSLKDKSPVIINSSIIKIIKTQLKAETTSRPFPRLETRYTAQEKVTKENLEYKKKLKAYEKTITARSKKLNNLCSLSNT